LQLTGIWVDPVSIVVVDAAVSFAPRPAVNASCDCKLAGIRVDPVSIVVVDAALFFIIISREMQSGGCQL
jgi:hypothetical protein